MELNQITLSVNEMSPAKQFYLELGCELIVDTPHYCRFKSPVGDSTLSLVLESQQHSNGVVIYFEDSDLDETVKCLQLKGFTFSQLPTEQSYLWREAILLDPSGNKIKLYWAGENRLNPPWKVSKTD